MSVSPGLWDGGGGVASRVGNLAFWGLGLSCGLGKLSFRIDVKKTCSACKAQRFSSLKV